MPHEQALDLWHAARLVLSHYPAPLPQGALTSPRDLPHGGGFSGASIFRLELPEAVFCLRAWSASDHSEQVAFRHRLMHHARCAGLSFVPALVAPRRSGMACPWAVSACGRLWDLCEWLPGRADFWSAPAPARLEAACRALAQLHCAWENMALPAVAPCPAIERRLGLLEHLRRLLQWPGHSSAARAVLSEPRPLGSGWGAPRPLPHGRGSDRACSGSSAYALGALEPLVETARTLLPCWLEQIPRLLEPWRGRLWPLQPCLCDVWHDHVLFCGHELTGIIDYGAVKIDHVAVDLARLLGSLVEDDSGAWKVGLTAYRQVRPLAAEEEALAHALDWSGTVLALGTWVSRLCEQPVGVVNVEGARRRMERLIQRVQRWDTNR